MWGSAYNITLTRLPGGDEDNNVSLTKMEEQTGKVTHNVFQETIRSFVKWSVNVNFISEGY